MLLSDIELTQENSFGRTDWNFAAQVNPTPNLEAFGDSQLAEMLDGQMIGRPVTQEEIDAASQGFGMALSVTMPADDTASVWEFSYGDAPTTIETASSTTRSQAIAWLNIARIGAALVVLVILTAIAAWIYGKIRTPKGRGKRATRRAMLSRRQRAAEREEEARQPRQGFLRLLVVDVHGIIVRPTDPLEGLLLPTIRAELPNVDADLVRSHHHQLILGRMTPEEFWGDLGLGPVARPIETRFLSSYRLVPGLQEFLDRISERSLPVAVIGNQPRRWGERLQRMAQIEESVSLWLTSAEVGATLPSPPLLEASRRQLLVDAADCLYLSSVPDNLDTAANIGMNTAYFAATPDDLIDTEHVIVKGFEDILRHQH